MGLFSFFKRKIKEPVDIWQGFAGRANTPEVLDEKAMLFAAVLLDWLSTGVRNLIERMEKDAPQRLDDKFGEIFFEMIVFCLFYVDRVAADNLDDEMRKSLTIKLSREVQNLLVAQDMDEKTRKRTEILFDVMYTTGFQEYRKYKFVNENDEALKGTLFWEFEKKIVRALGFKEDIIVLMHVHIHITTLLKHLQIPRLLRSDV